MAEAMADAAIIRAQSSTENKQVQRKLEMSRTMPVLSMRQILVKYNLCLQRFVLIVPVNSTFHCPQSN
jgi:hypothetical protein